MPLRITIHSDSVLDAISKGCETAAVLLKSSFVDELDFLMTPTSKRIPEEFSQITQARYSEYEEGFIVHVSTKKMISKAFCRRWIPSDWAKDVFGYPPTDPNSDRIMQALYDICAHESLSRDLFVTEDQDILSKKSWIESRFHITIVSALEALEHVDLFLKQHEVYYANPHFYYDKLGHYWFRTKDLLPAFREAWSIAVFGKEVIPNGQEILSHLQSFSERFQNLLLARDKIGIEFFKVPNNLTRWEMFYHLNYFILLVTGLFDSLAWLTEYRYSMSLNKLDIALKIEPEKQSSNFSRALKAYNQDLSLLLTDEYNKLLIWLFYPLRDSIQHREVLEGGIFGDMKGMKFNACILKPDAENAIKAIDKIVEESDFSLWGLYQKWSSLLEPYTFVKTSLKEVGSFSNTYLQKLNFKELIRSYEDIQQKIVASQKSEKEMEKGRELMIKFGKLLFW